MRWLVEVTALGKTDKESLSRRGRVLAEGAAGRPRPARRHGADERLLHRAARRRLPRGRSDVARSGTRCARPRTMTPGAKSQPPRPRRSRRAPAAAPPAPRHRGGRTGARLPRPRPAAPASAKKPAARPRRPRPHDAQAIGGGAAPAAACTRRVARRRRPWCSPRPSRRSGRLRSPLRAGPRSGRGAHGRRGDGRPFADHLQARAGRDRRRCRSTYREYVYLVPPGTTEAAAETLLATQFELVRSVARPAAARQAGQPRRVRRRVPGQAARCPRWRRWSGRTGGALRSSLSPGVPRPCGSAPSSHGARHAAPAPPGASGCGAGAPVAPCAAPAHRWLPSRRPCIR